MIDNNHKKIVFVGATIIESGVVSERLRGYKKALEDNGIAFDKSLVVYESEFSVIEQFGNYFKLEDVLPEEVRGRLKDDREYWGGSTGGTLD